MQSSNEAFSMTSKCFPQDFPPVPKCFLHLVSNSSESSLEEHSDSQFASDDTNILEDKNNDVLDQKFGPKTSNLATDPLSHQSLREGALVSSENTTSKFSPTFRVISPQDADNSLKIVEGEDSNENRHHLGKLNSSLTKLKREMTDLRTLDVNLFFQLISLHEAIQDFKMTVGERFSETASEYSLGSASYMGSMSSLSEEDSDWLESLQQSHSSGRGLDDSQVFVDKQSASSLLDQITALVQRADADF